MTAALALPSDSLALLAKVRATAAQIGAIIGVAPFDSPEREATAGQLLRAIVTLDDEADAERKRLKAPHLKAGRDVDEEFRQPQADLHRVRDLISARLREAAVARETARRLAVAQVAPAVAAGDAVAANAALVLANDPVFAPVTGPGISERFTWEAVSFDPRKMPVEYLTVDMVKVKAEIKDADRLGRDPAIPGVEFRRAAGLRVGRL
jgi:hypothetical protein